LDAPYWDSTQGPAVGESEIKWVRDFEYVTMDGKRKITGNIGLLETMSRNMSGLFLHYRGKGMSGIGASDINDSELKDTREYYRPQRIFGQEGSYRYQRFTGEFDISALGKTASTDSIKWNEDEEEEFLVALEIFLKDSSFNMWAMAENYQVRKAKKLLESNSNSGIEDFSISEVNEIANRFLESIRPEVVFHENEISDSTVSSSLTLVPQNEFLISETSWIIRDSSNHAHKITPEFIEDARLELFELVQVDSSNHELRINIGHPFVRRFQWGNKDVRQALISMIYLMSIPEMLLPHRCSKSSFKIKIFEILNSTMKFEAAE
jgi:hypothetical protein